MLHFAHFKKDLIGIHVWRQTQTQSNIVNFYEEDFNILHPKKNDRGRGNGIFKLEFPLMQWLVAALYKVFGPHLWITRFFMFLVSFSAVLAMYFLLKNLLQNEHAAIAGAWMFNFSPSMFYYAVTPLPDVMALSCSLWGLAFFYAFIRKQKEKFWWISLFFLSVGTLVKLPYILFFGIPGIYFLQKIKWQWKNSFYWMKGIGLLLFAFAPFLWYAGAMQQLNGNGIVKGVFENNVSIQQYFMYAGENLFSVLPENLLNYGSVPFLLLGLYFVFWQKSWRGAIAWQWIAFCVLIFIYFFFELNMIKNHHDYYLFPFYPMLFVTASIGFKYLYQKWENKRNYLSLFLLLLPVLAWARMHQRWDVSKPNFNENVLNNKSAFQSCVPNDALCVVGNDESHFILFYHLNKKGWAFNQDKLGLDSLQSYINQGAQFMYCDSRKIDSNPQMMELLDTLLLQKGDMKVWRLKKSAKQ